jgi:hypothetical protein
MTLSLVAGFAISPVANAGLVEADWLSEGDNLALLDTNTGLEWLDFTETQNQSYNNVISQLNTTFDTWRLPTFSEVSDFFNNAFGSYTSPTIQQDFAPGSTGYNEAATFASLLNSNPLSGDIWSFGIYGANSTYQVIGTQLDSNLARVYKDAGIPLSTLDQSNAQWSTILVRNSTSESTSNDVPITFGMGVLLTASFFGMRRKKR